MNSNFKSNPGDYGAFFDNDSQANSPVKRSGPQLGRNDPCHCGSGKKYKKCHLAADQETTLPPKFTEQDLETAKAYLERGNEIDVALKALAPYEAEYDKFLKDSKAFFDRVGELFKEDVFIPFRFTVEDLERASVQVGVPETLIQNERAARLITNAVIHLADKRRRDRLGMGLYVILPEFVKAGRFMDAWIINELAGATITGKNETNPFLLEMFGYGHTAWMDSKGMGGAGFLKELGVDPGALRKLSPQEAEEWLEKAEKDPVITEKFAAFLKKNPEHQARLNAEADETERDSLVLLGKEIDPARLLTQEEIAYWSPIMLQRIEATLAEAHLSLDEIVKEKTELFLKHIFPVYSKMAGELFSEERLLKLIDELQLCSKELSADGKAATLTINGMINLLKHEKRPEYNRFLVAVCMRGARA